MVRAVRKVSPAVVNISSESEIQRRQNPFSGMGLNPFFDNFFRDFFEHGRERAYKRTSLGSGVIIDGRRGFVITNAHVIENASQVTAVLQDEREFTASIVGADPDSDLAVLRISSDEPLPSVPMGSSEDLMIGETVIAIGNPFGFSHSVTTGVISALKRNIRTEERVFQDFIQLDASINPGNSGGPLLNINGDLIGINTAIYAQAQGIGFAIPIRKARRIIEDLIAYGQVVHAWVGIAVQEMDGEVRRYLQTPDPGGVLVRATTPGGPADSAGVRPGDVILKLAGHPTTDRDSYAAALRAIPAGETIDLRLWRDGKRASRSIRSQLFPMEQAEELAWSLVGLRVADHSGPGAAITSVRRGSELGRIGVRPGDIVRRLDDVVIDSRIDFEQALVRYRLKKSMILLIQREGRGYYITVRL